MKLLLENWRQYLVEQESQLLLEKQWEDWTVADLQSLMDLSREGENIQARRAMAKILGTKLATLIPKIGVPVAGYKLLKTLFAAAKRKPEGVDTAEDFPVLSIINMDPNLIATIEDDILNAIDEKYQTYLSELSPDTRLSDVTSINDFIRQRIAAQTDNHVVIRDEAS